MVKMKMLDVYLSRKDFIIKPALEELAAEISDKVHEATVLDGGVIAIDILKDSNKFANAETSRALGQIGLRANKGNNKFETVVFALIGDDVISINPDRQDSEIVDINTIEKEKVKKLASKKLGIS